jgi:hypothetical protein
VHPAFFSRRAIPFAGEFNSVDPIAAGIAMHPLRKSNANADIPAQYRLRTFAALARWDALLADVIKQLRCSKCGKRTCSATVRSETKRDG